MKKNILLIRTEVAVFSLIFLMASCLEIEEISFVPFEASFEAPATLRQGETLVLKPGPSTVGAQSFEWSILERGQTTREASLVFRFDSLGAHTIRLRTSIRRSSGLRVDSAEQRIWVIPPTEPLTNPVQFGSPLENESLQDVLPLPQNSGYIMLGRKDVNTLVLIRMDSSGEERWRTELSDIGNGRIQGEDIVQSRDGGFLVVGRIRSSPQDEDAFILKLEEQADRAVLLWQNIIRSIESEAYTSVHEVIQGLDTTYYAVATLGGEGQGTLLVDRYGPQGERKGSQFFPDQCRGCVSQSSLLVEDGDVPRLVVAGQESDRPAVFQLDLRPEGTLLSGKLVLDQLRGQGRAVRQLSDGKFVIVGGLESGEPDSLQAFMASFDVVDQSVLPNWISRTAFYQEAFQDVREDSNRDLIALGTHFNPLSQNDILLCRFDVLSGRLKGSKLLGGVQDEEGVRLVRELEGWRVFGSQKTSSSLGFQDILASELALIP